MDTCEAMNVIDKLNQEFDDLQKEKDDLQKDKDDLQKGIDFLLDLYLKLSRKYDVIEDHLVHFGDMQLCEECEVWYFREGRGHDDCDSE